MPSIPTSSTARSTNQAGEISSPQFYQGMERVLEEMDMVKTEVKAKVKEMEENTSVQIKKLMVGAGSFRSSSSSPAQKVTTVGLEEVVYEMLDKVAGGGLRRQIIPIVGMGGLGKTTLARCIYENPLIKERFDVCAWSTISQVHNTRKILGEILAQVDKEKEKMGDLSEYELGEKLYKYLIGRRYLIVMDDMWSVEAWDGVSRFLPEDENGSRVVVTTRLSNLASEFNYSDGIAMKFLDETSSWNLFSTTVFGEETFPPQLEDVGKKIVEGCKGLPLSIVVIGGLLSRSEPTRENWEVVAENLNSVVNSEDNGNCLQTLYMSYNNLPCYLKPCFLYLGIFYEDEAIGVRLLIALLVAEGIIKPSEGKSLEEVAEDCIEELVDRNLVLVGGRNGCGVLTSLKIHDLVRDVCLREARKYKFLCPLMQSTDREIPRGVIRTQRRIVTALNQEYPPSTPLLETVEASSSLVRTLIGKFSETLPISSFRLLRVCLVDRSYYEGTLIRMVNLRFLYVNCDGNLQNKIPFMVYIQTLLLYDTSDDYVWDIWKMPQLRHVTAEHGMLRLPDPPRLSSDTEGEVLENLQTLSVVRNLKFGDGLLKRIPNVKILKLAYYEEGGGGGGSDDYCLNNLCHLHKLQALRVRCSTTLQPSMRELALPHSLKKLTLQNTKLPWEEMTTKIGWLPHLQVLKLKQFSFTGSEWETVEGQFSSLKYLLIERCALEWWTTDSYTHFLRLELLVLRWWIQLEE